MAGLKDFTIDVLAGVYADPRVQAALAKLIHEQVMPLIPLAAAAAAKALDDQISKKFSSVLNMDPDIPGISDVFDLSEIIRTTMNGHPEVNIPIIGDFLKTVGGNR